MRLTNLMKNENDVQHKRDLEKNTAQNVKPGIGKSGIAEDVARNGSPEAFPDQTDSETGEDQERRETSAERHALPEMPDLP